MTNTARSGQRIWTGTKWMLAKAAWRIPAAVGWLWLLSNVLPSVSFLRPLQGMQTGYYLLLIGTCGLLYVTVQGKRSTGCTLFLIGFPLYLILFPLVLTGSLVSGLAGAVVTGARRSQEIKAAILPYLTTAMILAWLIRPPSPPVGAILVIVVSINIFFAVLSLAVWIFSPLRWLSGAVEWGLAYVQKKFKASLPIDSEIPQSPDKLVDRIKDSVDKAKRGHGYLVRFQLIDLGGVQPLHQDLVLTVGFVRKFFVTLIHLVLLFSILQYVSLATSSAGSGFPAVDQGFTEVWAVHGYEAAMTLLGNAPSTVPTNGLGRAVAVSNAYTGVVLLVLLVTTFSMLTRERARAGVHNLVKRVEAVAMTLEWHFVEAAAQTTQIGIMDPQLLNELKEVERFSILPKARVEAFHGILAINDMWFQTYLGPDVDAARVLARARREFGIPEYKRLMLQLRQFGSEVELDKFVLAVKDVLESPAGLVDSESGDLQARGGDKPPTPPVIRLRLPVERLAAIRTVDRPRATLSPTAFDDDGREQKWADAYNRGAEALALGNIEAALEQFIEADRLYQRRPEAKIALGSVYVSRGQTEAAAEAYLGALAILNGPMPKEIADDDKRAADWAESRQVTAFNAAQLLAQAGDYTRAAEILQGFLDAHEDKLEAETALKARTALAGFLAQAGDAETAEAMYEEILNRPDITVDEYFQAGIGFFNTSNYARAAEAFESAAKLNPCSRDAVLNLVQALYSQAMEIEETEETPERNQELRTIYDRIVEAGADVREMDPLNRNVVSFMLRSYLSLADLGDQAQASQLTQRTQELVREYQAQAYDVSDIQISMQPDDRARVSGKLANLNAAAGQQVQLQFELLNEQGQVIAETTVGLTTPEQGEAAQFSTTLDVPDRDFAGWQYSEA